MKATRENIDTFFEQKNIAVIGASAKSKKFGNDVIKELINKDYKVFVVHPFAESIENQKCFRSINDLPDEVDSLHISVNKSKTNELVASAVQKGIKNVWVQQMSDNETTETYSKDCNLILKQCILMHAQPVKGVHKFHRSIKSFFGLLPK
ncbi:MAG: CoA-binding protein [Bacteroidales bacterium]|nr:CoA-binding protein [Bacteroidales bacterium]